MRRPELRKHVMSSRVLLVGILLTTAAGLALLFEGRLTVVVGIGLALSLSRPASPRRCIARIDRAMLAMIRRGPDRPRLALGTAAEQRRPRDARARGRARADAAGTDPHDDLARLSRDTAQQHGRRRARGLGGRPHPHDQRRRGPAAGRDDRGAVGSRVRRRSSPREHRACIRRREGARSPGETVVRTARGQTIPVAVHCVADLERRPRLPGARSSCCATSPSASARSAASATWRASTR